MILRSAYLLIIQRWRFGILKNYLQCIDLQVLLKIEYYQNFTTNATEGALVLFKDMEHFQLPCQVVKSLLFALMWQMTPTNPLMKTDVFMAVK